MAWQPTACILCESNCGVEVRVDGSGGFARVRGDKAHPASQGYTCEKALRLGFYQSAVDRIDAPLRRRPDGSFEEIDWETAIAEVAGRLRDVRDTYGGETILYYGGGGQGNHLGGAYATATRAALASRFRSSALAQEKTGEFWINHRMVGGSVRGDFEHTELALFIGKNPWQSHGFARARSVIKAIARDPERTLMVIDTRRTETAELADVFLQVRPGTDAYCLAAIGATLVQERLVDAAFIADRTSGYDEVAAVLSGIDVGRFSDRCGVAPDRLRDAARRIGAATSVAVFEDLGIQQAPNSTLASYLEKLVWLLTGNFAKPGSQHPAIGLVDVGNGRESSHVSPVTGARIIGGMIPANVIADEILTNHPARFRAMIVESANPAHSLAGSRRMREALAALDVLVVIDVALSETARAADYVLPASSQYEKWEATFFNFEFPSNTFHLRAPVLEPRAGTLAEPEIHSRLCEELEVIDRAIVEELAHLASTDRNAFAMRFAMEMGSDPVFARLAPVILWRALGPRLEERFGAGAASAAVLWGACQRLALVDAEAVREAGHRGEGPALGDALFDSIMTSRSGTVMASGRWSKIWERVPGGRVSLALPDLLEELASLETREPVAGDPDFPFVLAAGERRSFTANTIMRDPGWRKRDREGALRMNPADADALGVDNGDLVRVVTRSGSAVARVELTDTLQRSNVTLPNGLGTDYPGVEGAEVTGVSPNELTTTGPGTEDPFVGTPFHKHVPARVERLAT